MVPNARVTVQVTDSDSDTLPVSFNVTIVDDVPHELCTGDSFYLASDVPHGVETILPTRVLDTFSPPRDDYLAIDKERTE